MLVLKAAHHPAFAALEPVLPSGVPLRKWGFKRKLNFPGTSLYLSTQRDQQQRDQSYEAITVQSLLFSRAWKREKIAV